MWVNKLQELTRSTRLSQKLLLVLFILHTCRQTHACSRVHQRLRCWCFGGVKRFCSIDEQFQQCSSFTTARCCSLRSLAHLQECSSVEQCNVDWGKLSQPNLCSETRCWMFSVLSLATLSSLTFRLELDVAGSTTQLGLMCWSRSAKAKQHFHIWEIAEFSMSKQQ